MKIEHYFVEYIWSLDFMLADLKKANITISRGKSQFYYFRIRIKDYICDFEEQYPYTFKVFLNYQLA